jgi:hypothetical protein
MEQSSVIRRVSSILLAVTVAASLGLTLRAFGAADTKPCSTNPESRQLDYWVGEWKISGPGAGPDAVSKVHLVLDQCMVVENWDGGRGHTGENMFGYSVDDKSWHAMFVDNQGRVHVFTAGKVSAGTAEFSGPSKGANGEMILNRVRIVRMSPDKVEQVWEKSSDKGATWVVDFHGEYVRSRS